MSPAVVCQAPQKGGGAERYLVTLYRSLRDRGHVPTLIGRVPGWTESEMPRIAVPLGPKWGGRTTLKLLPRLPLERAATAHLIDRAGGGFSHYHVQFKREQIGLTDLLNCRAPVLWTEHGRFARGREGRWLARGYSRAAQNASTIICVSDAVADDVRAIVGPAVPVVVVPNAVDTSALRPPTNEGKADARAALGLPNDRPVIAWVGQVHAGKLPHLAVETGRRFQGVTAIAGRGFLAEQVAAEADGDRVRYFGHLDDPSTLYRAADLFLFTSSGVNEGTPYALLEAAAHGLPIVANESFGDRAMVESAGGVVAADDAPSLSSAATFAVDEIAERGSAARAWAEDHDLRPWAAAHETILAELWRHWRHALK